MHLDRYIFTRFYKEILIIYKLNIEYAFSFLNFLIMIIFHILQRLVSKYFIAECIENWLTWIFLKTIE